MYYDIYRKSYSANFALNHKTYFVFNLPNIYLVARATVLAAQPYIWLWQTGLLNLMYFDK